MVQLKKDEPIVIVGAGVFGLSTALHLLEREYTDVTLLERGKDVPARDSAGYDLNKIVRSSYSDPFYTELARDAIRLWKGSEWKGCYHESGVFVPFSKTNPVYVREAYENDISQGARVSEFRTETDARQVFPEGVPLGVDFSTAEGTSGKPDLKAYMNHDGGWAESGRSLDVLLERVRAMGAKVFADKEVSGTIQAQSDRLNDPRADAVAGVRCADGSGYEASVVIVAAGAWTPMLMQRWGLESQSAQEKLGADSGMHVGVGMATGQTVAMIQLTPEDAERYRSCPVVLDFGSGFYIFPPTADNVVKCAIHGNGYLHRASESSPSAPRTALTDGKDGLRIPKDAVQALREGLRGVYPELAKKAFTGTRLCWYNDSSDDDWVIGRHPTLHGIVFATAGNGHAFKFLPNIGRLVADALEDKLTPEVAARFAPHRAPNAHAPSRGGPPTRPLDLGQLCERTDLDGDSA